MTAKSSREAPIARLTFETISASPQPLGFFEVHAENYMEAFRVRTWDFCGKTTRFPCMASD